MYYEIEAYRVPLYDGDPLPWHAVVRCKATGQMLHLTPDCASEWEAIDAAWLWVKEGEECTT